MPPAHVIMTQPAASLLHLVLSGSTSTAVPPIRGVIEPPERHERDKHEQINHTRLYVSGSANEGLQALLARAQNLKVELV
mmetsp:Transcript_14664/g.26278  ORF Transcript_14664/g.26278 Transcript_14664/m.26278 type:complete len:80 (+) Transcript_14664:88-327(+)